LSLSGSITALATPFTAVGELDLDAWHRLLRQQLDGGTQGIVVAGSTGEAAALTDDEYELLIRTAVAAVAGRIPVLAGTGQMNTARTIAQTRRAAEAGAGFALVVTPPYVRPTQAGLVAHYRAVADQGGLPVVLYNVPGRTGCDLLPETVAELVGHPGIVGTRPDEHRDAPGRLLEDRPSQGPALGRSEPRDLARHHRVEQTIHAGREPIGDSAFEAGKIDPVRFVERCLGDRDHPGQSVQLLHAPTIMAYHTMNCVSI
jgi:hypothetical protein